MTVYDNAQRVISTVERSSSSTVIVGYEYSYDNLGRILSEKHLAKNIKYDYTYDSLSRVTKRILTNLSDNTTSEEVYAYDNAGNITSCTVSNGANTFVYDQNNRLISYNGQAVTYDMDGNMLSATLNGAQMSFVYDSANRLISAGQNSYTYNVEDVRVRNLCGESETTYAYNTNGRLSQLLVKTTDGVITKYVYGIGLIGEETSGSFKTYHFDYRGSTAAITDINGNVTDTFEYDTYGNLVSRTGTSAVIFLYNGRDGVVTDSNGLIYMRARYYSPELRRFINADIIAGEISNAVTLNRYAYANGNPVSNIDPFGLSAERGNQTIYSGSIWNDSFEPDMLYADISIIQLMKILSPLSSVKSEKQHLDTWKRLVKLLTNEKMQPILMDMIEHFCTGKGSDYSNAQLTNAVKYHTVTQDYMKDFSDVFKTYMSKYNGDYTAFAQSDNFRDDLKANGVLISKYSYGGGLFDEDTWGGLTMAIHGWTENRVDITDSFIIGNKYYTNLQFTFIDNFGLDRDDLREFGIIPGFESWYALQHNKNYQGKYQPFKTVVTIDYQVVGWL